MATLFRDITADRNATIPERRTDISGSMLIPELANRDLDFLDWRKPGQRAVYNDLVGLEQAFVAAGPKWRVRDARAIDGSYFTAFNECLIDRSAGKVPQYQPLTAVCRHRAGWVGRVERIATEIGRLFDGWDGPGSVAPTTKTQRDVEHALVVLPPTTPDPEVEVDSSDGSVCVHWDTDGLDRSVSFNFSGNGKTVIVGLMLGQPPMKPEVCDVTDETRILDSWDRIGGFDLLEA